MMWVVACPNNVVAVTVDHQLLVDPASNSDRGLVSLLGVWLHLERVVGTG